MRNGITHGLKAMILAAPLLLSACSHEERIPKFDRTSNRVQAHINAGLPEPKGLTSSRHTYGRTNTLHLDSDLEHFEFEDYKFKSLDFCGDKYFALAIPENCAVQIGAMTLPRESTLEFMLVPEKNHRRLEFGKFTEFSDLGEIYVPVNVARAEGGIKINPDAALAESTYSRPAKNTRQRITDKENSVYTNKTCEREEILEEIEVLGTHRFYGPTASGIPDSLPGCFVFPTGRPYRDIRTVDGKQYSSLKVNGVIHVPVRAKLVPCTKPSGTIE